MKSNATFKDVIGLDNIKEKLKDRFEDYYDYKDDLKASGFEPSKGMLLYGIPGTGKTLVMQAALNEYIKNNRNLLFHIVDAESVMSGTVGEASKKIKAVFDNLRMLNTQNGKDYVLIMDEIDVLMPNRNTRSVLAIERTRGFLNEMDGLGDNGSIYILGATNRPWDIDPAFLRSGRFDDVIHVPPPDKEARKGLLEYYITTKVKLDDKINSDVLIDWTSGYVGADFKDMGKQLFILSKKRQKAGQDATIAPIDIMKVFKGKKSVDSNLFKIAEFEAEYYKFEHGNPSDFNGLDIYDKLDNQEQDLKDLLKKPATYAI